MGIAEPFENDIKAVFYHLIKVASFKVHFSYVHQCIYPFSQIEYIELYLDSFSMV